jgi:nucleotide-binding universal stress UspA family protein
MWDMEPRKVLVGIESEDCDASLHYAVAEAMRRGCGIHLVHVARPSLFSSCALDDIALVDDELRRTDQMVLAAAEARVHALLDELAPEDDRLSVSTELTHGPVVAMMSSLSRHASRLVLEHRRAGPVGAAGPLSVTADLVVVAHCPVVVVQPGWRRGADAQGTVVVGVEDLRRADPLVCAADHEALRRGARLRVVMAAGAEAVGSAQHELPATVSDAELVVEVGDPADVLLAQAEKAELLVVGRHHRPHLVGTPLGRTVGHLLRHCVVPLLLVDRATGETEG